jgi:hypothetical protein
MGEPLRRREQPIGHPFRCHRVELANIASNMCQIDQCEPGEPYFRGGGGSSSGFPQLSSHRATSARGMSESRGNARAAAIARCLASVSSASNRSRSDAGSAIGFASIMPLKSWCAARDRSRRSRATKTGHLYKRATGDRLPLFGRHRSRGVRAWFCILSRRSLKQPRPRRLVIDDGDAEPPTG